MLQVNGKTRGAVRVPADADDTAIEAWPGPRRKWPVTAKGGRCGA